MAPDSLATPKDSDCPAGQAFYICEAGIFIGCCSADPCVSSRCPDIHLSLAKPEVDLRDPGERIQPMNPPDEEQLWPPTDTSKSSPSPKPTMTDSGTTHTIPNDEIITVTKHTLITTGKPPPPLTSTSASLGASLSGQQPTESVSEPPDLPAETGSFGTDAGPSGVALSKGAIAGMAIGGVVLLAAVTVLISLLKRRHKSKKAQNLNTEPGAYNGTVTDDFFDDKHFPRSISQRTTGTQEAVDPFAPFGGRADEPQLPVRPRDGAFEMDATSTIPVELPAVSLQPSNTDAPQAQAATNNTPITPVRQTPSKDPLANLNALRSENGQPAYVNHWDQYRALSGGQTGERIRAGE